MGDKLKEKKPKYSLRRFCYLCVCAGIRIYLLIFHVHIFIGVWGRGTQTGKFSEERYMCVRARGLCGERWLMLPGQNRGSECTAPPSAARISAVFVSAVVSVLSRFSLGVVSVLSRCCLGFVSGLSRFCLGVASMLSRCCLGVSRCYLGCLVFVLSRCLWKHAVETHYETQCENTLWKHTGETHCGNTVWKHNKETGCGNTLWTHTVDTHV